MSAETLKVLTLKTLEVLTKKQKKTSHSAFLFLLLRRNFFLMSHDISFVPSSIQHLFDILLRSLMFVCFCFFEIANYAQTEHATRRRFQVSAICRVDGRRSQCHVEDAGSQHFPMGLVQLQSLFHHRVSRVSHIRTTFSLYILYSSLLISFLYLII